MHLSVEKHHKDNKDFYNFEGSYNAELLNPYYSNQCDMALLQTTYS